MNRKLAFIIVLLIGILSANIFAGVATANQTVTIQIPKLELCRINAIAVTLGVSLPAIAGDPFIGSVDNSSYIQWTCLNMTSARSISMDLNVNPPAGTALDLSFVKTGTFSGTAAGATSGGMTAGPTYSCATAIGSGNTGTGATGIQLDYVLSITDTSLLTVGNTPITMTFTLTDSF